MSTYCYEFAPTTDLTEIESSLLLSVWATEALHGECQVHLDAEYEFDRIRRRLVADASTPVGVDLNRILIGYFRREFSREDFQVNRCVDIPGSRSDD